MITTEETRTLFPAQAGVFPWRARAGSAASTLPRSGGGISGYGPRNLGNGVSSPLRRGYFRCLDPQESLSFLFPAQAGVFPDSTCKP